MNMPDKICDPAERGHRDLIHNEQIKLGASFLNQLALLAIAMGLIVPPTFALAPKNEITALDVMILAPASFAAGIVLHLLGQKVLSALR